MATRRFLEPEPVSKELNDAMITLSLKVFDAPDVDLHNPEAVKQRVQSYFDQCSALGLRPGNMGLYASLGLSRQDVSDILAGRNKSKVSPACIDILQKAKQAMSVYREQLGSAGKINPVTLIFWQKNFDGLTDAQQIEISRADNRLNAVYSPEEIQRMIADIPVDIEPDEPDTTD